MSGNKQLQRKTWHTFSNSFISQILS